MEDNNDFKCNLALFDAKIISDLQSIFKDSLHQDPDPAFKAQEQVALDLTDCKFALTAEQSATLLPSAMTADKPVTEDSFSKTVSLKFMITKQDEKDLLNLGYSQTQINMIKPNEAAEILSSHQKLPTK